jgi:anti-anti-sigma regulatory factor
MLKITRETNSRFRTVLRLEGKLSGPWVESFAQLCSSGELDRPAGLDLASVQYVDEAGQRLLLALLDNGFQLVAASGFVKELLHLENR